MFVAWLAKMTDNKVTETETTHTHKISGQPQLAPFGPGPKSWPDPLGLATHTDTHTQISWLAQGHDVFIMPSAIFVLFLCFFFVLYFAQTAAPCRVT